MTRRRLPAGATGAAAAVAAIVFVAGVTSLGRCSRPAPAARAPSPFARPIADAPADADGAMAVHADPVASYTLDVAVDTTKHELAGRGDIRWKNASSAPANELYLHLYLNAFKNQRTVFLRGAVNGFRGAGLPATWGWIRLKQLRVREWDADVLAGADKSSPGDPDDETDVRVPLPRAVAPGETITLEVAWDERLPTVLLRTGYAGSFHMFAQWFPKIARREPDGAWRHFTFAHLSEFYADFGRYDVTVDAPEGFVVGATGELVDEKRDAGRVRRRFVENDVHDFAFTAWDGFAERTSKAPDGTALRILYPKGEERIATDELAAAGFGLERFGKRFGKYPYKHLTIVHPPEDAGEAGGMEYPTLITTGGSAWLSHTGVHAIETVTIHELGHQWFYGLVATDEHRSPFLDEGVNSYAEIEAMEALFPGRSMAQAFGIELGTAAVYRALASDAEREAKVAEAADGFPTGRDYVRLVYERTATILLTLARTYGEEGVARAVGRYARRYRFGHPTPDDFIASFRETLGDDVAETLRAALFDEATIDVSVDALESHEDATPRGIYGDPDKPTPPAIVEPGRFVGEVLVKRRGALVLPVEILLVAADGTRQRKTWDGKGGFARIPYSGASKLVAAVVDPDHRVLLDDDLANNARAIDGERVSPRVFEGATFAAQLGLSAGMP